MFKALVLEAVLAGAGVLLATPQMEAPPDKKVGEIHIRVISANADNYEVMPLIAPHFYVRYEAGPRIKLDTTITKCDVINHVVAMDHGQKLMANATVLKCNGTEFMIDGVLFQEENP